MLPELDISVAHVVRDRTEGHDDLAEIREGLVDVLRLREAVTSRAGRVQPFRTSQIDQIEKSASLHWVNRTRRGEEREM